MNKINTTILTVLLPVSLFAASIFSAGGIGIIDDYAGGRPQGMSVLGIALEDSMSSGFLNPALWSGITTTRFSAGFGISRFYWSEDGQNDLADDFELESAALGFSLKPGLTLGFHFHPVSRKEYRLVESNMVDSVNYTQILHSKGGLSKGSAVISLEVTPNIKLGLTAGLLWGSFQDTVKMDFTTSGYYDSEIIFERDAIGGIYGGGFHTVLKNRLNIGAFCLFPSDLSVDQSLDVHTDSILTSEYKIRFPLTAGVGIAVPLSNRVLGSADYLMRDWDGKRQRIGGTELYHRSHRFGMGIEIAPTEESLAPFIKRIAYRFGFGFASLYYHSLNDETVKQWNVSYGMGIPLKDNRARLDLVLSFIKRGDSGTNGISENIYRMSLYINAGEKWFERRKKY